MATRKRKAARCDQHLDGRGDRAATEFALHLYDKPASPESQAPKNLSALVDLALFEFEESRSRAQHYEDLASVYRRRAMRALDSLRAYEKLIPTGSQERAA